VILMGENFPARELEDPIRDRASAIRNAFEIVQLDVAHHPESVGGTIVEVALDGNGERWAAGEDFCKGKPAQNFKNKTK
jgi:hypothetical protein